MIWTDQCEMKPLFFELPAQAHPAPSHQLHLCQSGDLDQGDHLDEEDVDAHHLFPHGGNHGDHQAGDH